MKTSELTGSALDWAVAKCEGLMMGQIAIDGITQGFYKPSTDWAQGGPIIEREGIGIFKYSSKPEWTARTTDYPPKYIKGPTPLVAAMRCYVASKLGDDVEIPEELL